MRQVVQRLIKIDFLRFSLVGAVGFVINLTLFTLLSRVLRLPTFIAQAVASEVALFNNFLLHHHWTYKRHKVIKSIERLLWQFHASSWVAIIGTALLMTWMIDTLHSNFILALILTSLIALGWNFMWSKWVIWKHEHEDAVETDKEG